MESEKLMILKSSSLVECLDRSGAQCVHPPAASVWRTRMCDQTRWSGSWSPPPHPRTDAEQS